MKYDEKFKLRAINLYQKYGKYDYPDGVTKSAYRRYVKLWIRCFNDQGLDGLKHPVQNKAWTPDEKFKILSEVIAGYSFGEVALKYNINIGLVYSWVKKYREKGFDGLKLKKGRKPKVPIMTKEKKITLSKSQKEELELLRKRNEYLEIENEYLKKVRALELMKQATHPKAKKQK